jgi:hypothetical protein
VEIFTQSELTQTLNAPSGIGNPGWKILGAPGVEAYVYRSTAPSLRRMVLRDDKTLRIVSYDSGIPLTAPLGGVALRLRTGTLRNCAVFPASTVSRDVPGLFVAGDSSGSVLTDCSDASLLAALSLGCAGKGDYPTCGGACPAGSTCGAGPGNACTCVAGPEPCGNTEPSCNGACPSGKECVPIFDDSPNYASCVCTPTGVTPCGAVEPTMCDNGVGACPPDTTCQEYRVDVGIYICGCFDPNRPCGNGPGYCPPDSVCDGVPTGMGQYTCYPTFCTGPYPTCGGTCGGGRNCVPVTLPESGGICVCAAPENECEGQMCGGFSCPVGEACTPDIGTTACTCEPL